jgi:hypothetical protein
MANPTRNRIAEIDEELLLLEPEDFDEAIIGIAERADGMLAVAYDRTRCIDILARSMSREDAEEFFEFNTAGAWMGARTPVFVDTRAAE